MSDRVQVVEHQGRRIIYGDYSGTKGQGFIDVLEQQEAESLRSPDKSILHLLNFSDCNMSGEAKQRADQMISRLVEQGFTVRTAAFGLTGLQRVIANAVKKDIYFAKSIHAAKTWLVSP